MHIHHLVKLLKLRLKLGFLCDFVNVSTVCCHGKLYKKSYVKSVLLQTIFFCYIIHIHQNGFAALTLIIFFFCILNFVISGNEK